jgi:hypothetical protein
VKGEMSIIQEGCVIGFDRENQLIIIMPRSGDGSRLEWGNGDDKKLVTFLSDDNDFRRLVDIIADTHGLVYVKDDFERSYGPAYLLVKEKK